MTLRVAMVSVHTCPLAPLGSRETGGMNVYVRELSRRLGARGVAVDVFTRRQHPDPAEIMPFGENARVIHLEAGPLAPMDKYDVLDRLPRFTEGMIDFAEQSSLRYDLIHSHYWLSGQVGTWLSDRWQVPLVAMFHTLGRLKNSVSRDDSERESPARIDVERDILRRADRLVAASPTDMQHMLECYGADESRIRVIPGGVDMATFRPIPIQDARTFLELDSRKLVLFVGRIQPLKGIELLLRAFARLSAGWVEGPRPRLMVVGGDNPTDPSDPESMELDRLMRLAEELGVVDDVIFRGAIPHEALPTYYSAADVVVVPSHYESFGLVALEAMACGTPVVASRVGGLQGTVRDGDSGFLVDHREPEPFASAIEAVLLNEGLRGRMSEAAVRTAREYSWEASAEKTLDLYSELVPNLACLASH